MLFFEEEGGHFGHFIYWKNYTYQEWAEFSISWNQFDKLTLNASGQTAPHLVPEDKARYETTIDMRPVNVASISEAWPMPNFGSGISRLRR